MAEVRADSAGVPWSGRQFEPNSLADDDGSADPRLLEALRRFRRGEASESEVVDALRAARLLIPLVAHLAEAGSSSTGLTLDKSAELAIVTVAAPDGRNVMPVFSSVEAMQQWNPLARPVPSDAVRVGLAAASEHTDLVVLDPTSATEFVLRRPAVWAIARQAAWTPSHFDGEVRDALRDGTCGEAAITAMTVTPGDPDARLTGPELVVTLRLEPGLDATELDGLLARVQERWSHSEVIAARVDSLAMKVVS